MFDTHSPLAQAINAVHATTNEMPKPSQDEWIGTCPLHDGHGTLSLQSGKNDLVRMSCSKGCDPEQIALELGFPVRLLERKSQNKPSRVATGRPATAADFDAQEPTQWQELDRLDDGKLPEFPIEALPDALRLWVEAEAIATQTPLALPAMLSLAAVSSTIAGRIVVEPRHGWREPSNVYVAVLLDPANRKSRVFSDATAPLVKYETELVEAARPGVARGLSERRQLQHRLADLERKAAKNGDVEASQEAGELAEQLDALPEPVLPKLIVDDATGEKLGDMLARHDGRMTSMSAEGQVFDLMAGLYSKNSAPQFDVYLKSHSGDTLRTDRLSRKAVYVEQPALVCAYAIQPEVIRGIAGNPAFRGRGLLARFLYACPRSTIGNRQICPPPIPEGISNTYQAGILALAKHAPTGILRFSDAADNCLREWEREIEMMLREGGCLESLLDWGGKLAGATVRLTAILHVAEHVHDDPLTDVEPKTVQAAVNIARCLIPHAEHVLTTMRADGQSVQTDARYVLRWIKRHQRLEFSKRQLHQDSKRRFTQPDDLEPPLAELERRGYLRRRPAATRGPGRTPSPIYDVNPAVFEATQEAARPHNPQNPDATAPDEIFGDCEGAFGEPQGENRRSLVL